MPLPMLRWLIGGGREPQGLAEVRRRAGGRAWREGGGRAARGGRQGAEQLAAGGGARRSARAVGRGGGEGSVVPSDRSRQPGGPGRAGEESGGGGTAPVEGPGQL